MNEYRMRNVRKKNKKKKTHSQQRQHRIITNKQKEKNNTHISAEHISSEVFVVSFICFFVFGAIPRLERKKRDEKTESVTYAPHTNWRTNVNKCWWCFEIVCPNFSHFSYCFFFFLCWAVFRFALIGCALRFVYILIISSRGHISASCIIMRSDKLAKRRINRLFFHLFAFS